MAAIVKEIPPILDRLVAGSETERAYDRDSAVIIDLSSRLYSHSSAFAEADPSSFSILNEVSIRLNDLVYGEDQLTSPEEIAPAAIPAARDAIGQAEQAISLGVLDCHA